MSWLRTTIAIIGWPIELPRKLFAKNHKPYKVKIGFVFTCPYTKKTKTIPSGYRYDGATCAPNLRDKHWQISRAFAVHDKGWEDGTWDCGSEMSFDENNRNLETILLRDGFPHIVVDVYHGGVSLDTMRQLWIHTHKHQ